MSPSNGNGTRMFGCPGPAAHRLPQPQTRPPLPMLLVQSPASTRLPEKSQSLPVPPPHGRLGPLLLFIRHNQAGVQDVLFRLPRAVPGREMKGQSCPAPPAVTEPMAAPPGPTVYRPSPLPGTGNYHQLQGVVPGHLGYIRGLLWALTPPGLPSF